MAIVTIFGASGRTGRLVIKKALEVGHDVVAVARDPQRMSEQIVAAAPSGRLRIVHGDVREPNSLADNVFGSDVAISTISAPGRTPGGLYSIGTAAIVAALQAESVARFICVSSSAVRADDKNVGFWYRGVVVPLFMRALYADMREMEEVVRCSALDWTLVRPGYLRDGPSTGSYRVHDGRNPKRGWQVTRADLADFLVRQINDTTWIHRHPTLAN